MEIKNKSKLYTRLPSVGLVIGGVATAIYHPSEQKTSERNVESLSTFVFPDGTKCIDGIYFGFKINGLNEILVKVGETLETLKRLI